MDDIQKLSALNIRFLLEIPSCVGLTKALNCTKPSVHKMMKVLDKKGLISHKKRIVPTFTLNGLRIASQYAVYHQKMDARKQEMIKTRLIGLVPESKKYTTNGMFLSRKEAVLMRLFSSRQGGRIL